MAKYGIDFGHNCPPDTGCAGLRQEDELIMLVGNQVTQKLRLLGHKVVECLPIKATTVKNSLEQRAQIANNAKVDVFASIHFNCFNKSANGTEVHAISVAGLKIAQRVVSAIAELGFVNRGVKSDKFKVLRETNAPAILIECCFCDSPIDMKIFDAEKMSDAIVLGLTGKLPAPDQLSLMIE